MKNAIVLNEEEKKIKFSEHIISESKKLCLLTE